MTAGLVVCSVVLIAFFLIFKKGLKKDRSNYVIPENTRDLLTSHIAFYNDLDDINKQQFEDRVKNFLSNIAIRGIGVTVEDIDRVLVASGAIIPIFAFPDWRYNNLGEVLLYKSTFSKDYSTEGEERNVLGMVGEGVMNREMILSQPSLRASFQNPTDGHNTAIHEFVHLIDKADGATDGIPEYLVQHAYVLPWVNRMHETIKEMQTHRKTDINPYGATNDAEFFAVVSEYFFERPSELKAKHPELYTMLDEMFHTKK